MKDRLYKIYVQNSSSWNFVKSEVISNIEELTPEKLTKIFRKQGYLNNGKVTKITNQDSIECFHSNLHFLELSISNNGQTDEIPSEIVVKMPKTDDLSKLAGKYEARFFTIVTEKMKELTVPTCFDLAFSEETGCSHVILENLSKSHVELSDLPVPPLKMHCEKAIESLAIIHASWWDRVEEITNLLNEKIFFEMYNLHKQELHKAQEFLGERMSDKRRKVFKKVYSIYPKLHWNRIKNKKNLTLLHGDAGFWNFFYPKNIENEKEKTYLIDWQSWSPGFAMCDLAYMIGLHWYPERRKLMEKDLIEHYYNVLVKQGVKNFSWDDCWSDYKLGAIRNLYIPISQCSTGISAFVWWPHFERAWLTFEDLNCMEVLESKSLD
ncbi:MAG: phosphotransferase [Candidatus Hodarchaeales archaeon]|jgi:thiamine kinase-like enzyme